MPTLVPFYGRLCVCVCASPVVAVLLPFVCCGRSLPLLVVAPRLPLVVVVVCRCCRCRRPLLLVVVVCRCGFFAAVLVVLVCLSLSCPCRWSLSLSWPPDLGLLTCDLPYLEKLSKMPLRRCMCPRGPHWLSVLAARIKRCPMGHHMPKWH